MKKILIAGIGNVLRRDDGFGIAVARSLQQSSSLPAGAVVEEYGIAGIGLVQELMAQKYDLLIIADAAKSKTEPGKIRIIKASVPDLPQSELQQVLTEPHTAEPSRVLIIAKALNVLPEKVYLVLCEPEDCDELCLEMTLPVSAAVNEAVVRIEELVQSL